MITNKSLTRIKKCAYLLVILAFGCTTKPQPDASISIALTTNKQALIFKGLDAAIMNEIARDSAGSGWQSLVPVYRMPADTDMKTFQPVQPGKYLVQDSVVVFTPDTPFVKGQTYFVRWYRYNRQADANSYIKGSRQLGQTQFTDLIFKQ